MPPSPIPKFTAVVTDAMKAARDAAVDKLPAAVDVVKSAALAAKGTAVDKLPAAADSVKAAALTVKDTAMKKLPAAADAVKSHATVVDKFLADASAVASGTAQSMAKSSKPWLAMVLHFLQYNFVRVVKEHAIAVWKFQIATAAAGRETARAVFEASKPWLARFLREDFARWVKLQAVEAWKILAAAAAFTGEGVQALRENSKVFLTMALRYMHRHRVLVGTVLALWCGRGALLVHGPAALALAFETMKAPGLAGLRIPRVVFEASPRLYFATVRTGRIVCRGAAWAVGVLPTPVLIGAGVCAAYLIAKRLYKREGY